MCGTTTEFTLGDQYELSPPTATTDRTVASVTRCGIGEHVTVGATATSDAMCRAAVHTCPDGSVVSPDASTDAEVDAVTDDPQCVKCANGSTSYNAGCPGVCPGHHTQTNCSQIGSTHGCGAKSYYTPGLAPGHPGKSCTRCTVCLVEYTPCTANADAVCFSTNRSSGIQQCPTHQYRDDSTPGSIGLCRQCSDCEFKDVRHNCTPNHDRACEAYSSEEFGWLWAIVGLTVMTIEIMAFRCIPLFKKREPYIASEEHQQLIQKE